MPRAPAESRAIAAGKWTFALLIPASALALGSVPIEALIVMSALAAASCALLWSGKSVATSDASRWVLLAFAVLLGATILQAVPLPSSVAQWLSPANADIWERALSPLREPGPSWHTISIAPSATRVELLKGFFYGSVFLAALRITTLEHGERFLVRLIVVSSTAMALSALAHNAVGAEKVFGLYRPHELYAYQRGRYSPLLNTNHLAAYLGIGACVSLGALLSGRAMPRALSGSTMLVLAATCVWQSSRGATGALFIGFVLTFALTLYAKRSTRRTRVGGEIVAGCAIGATLILTIVLSRGSTHLLSHDLTKVGVAHSSLKLVAASPWFGVGRGGFESVYWSVRNATDYMTFTNPEDLLVQWSVDWGVPVTLACLAILAWALRPQNLLRAVTPAIGVWVALVASVVHELVDYHFEVPGIVALGAVCAAIVVSGRGRTPPPKDTRPSPVPRTAAFALAAGTVVAAAVAWNGIGHTLMEERRRFSAEAVDRSVPREQFIEGLREAMLRYPAEPFLPLMGAARAQANAEGSVLPWVARALERNPRFGRAHYVLARSLASRHRAQARLEYRLAYEYDQTLRYTIVREVDYLIDDPASALELIPAPPLGNEMLDMLVGIVAVRLPSTAVILDRELEQRAPEGIGPLRRRADVAASDAINDAPWCAGRRDCTVEALAAATELLQREPEKCASHVRIARLEAKDGQVASALDGLETSVTVVADRAECQRQVILLAMEYGQTRRADQALDQLVRAGCGAAAECVDLYSWAAAKEEGRGRYARAITLYRRVIDLAPEREDLLEHIGEMGSRDGLLAEALDAYGTLALRHPSDPRWPARIAELRAKRTPPRPGMQLPPP